MMDKPVEALQQSFLRTKARDLKRLPRRSPSSRPTARTTPSSPSAKGEIAYLHPQFVPRRNDRFDYTRPVDGSDPATDWGALHAIARAAQRDQPAERLGAQRPTTGPTVRPVRTAPTPKNFPKYMDMFGENYRGMHALQLLTGSRGWTLDRLQAAAFDSAQPGFAALIPSLIKAYDALPKKDPRRARLAGPIAVLRSWDYRWAAGSVPQSLAMFWVDGLMKAAAAPEDEPVNVTTTQARARHQRRARSSPR